MDVVHDEAAPASLPCPPVPPRARHRNRVRGEGFVELGQFVAGGRYTVVIQHFVAPGDLPSTPPPPPGEPGEDGFGTLEVFVFACDEGGDATQLLVSESDLGAVAALAAAAGGPAVPDTCVPGSASIALDGSAETIQVETGLTFFNVPAGSHSIAELCSQSTTEFGAFAGETTKILIFDFGAACAAGPTTPSGPTPTAPRPTATTPAAATPVTAAQTVAVTTLPNAGAGPEESPARSEAGTALLAVLALAGLGLALVKRRRLVATER